MANKSVIDIEINDAQFQAFTAAFAKYQTALAAQPKMWKDVAGSSKPAIDQAAVGLALMNTQLRKADTGAKSADHSLKGYAKTAWSVAGAFKNITFNVAKWVALGGLAGLATGAAGLFGLGGLASAAGSNRRQAQGLGVAPGDLKAAQVNYSKYLDAASTLGNIADAQSDLSKRWIFNSVGLPNAQNQTPGQLLPELLPKLVEAFRQAGGTQQGAEARGLTQLVDFQTLRRLASLSPDELERTGREYGADRQRLASSDQTLTAWQRLNTQLDRAGEAIQTSLINRLVPLAPAFERLSGGITQAIDSLLSSPRLAGWIDGLGASVQKLGIYLGSDSFQNDVRDFIQAIADMARAVRKATDWLGITTPRSTREQGGRVGQEPGVPAGPGAVPATPARKPLSVSDAAAARYLASVEQARKLPGGVLDAIYAQESGRGRNVGPSAAGAEGPFQLMPPTAKQYGVSDPYSLAQSGEAAGHVMADLMRKYKGDLDKSLAAYNWGQGNVDKTVAARGDNWKQGLPAETVKYLTDISKRMGEARATVKVVVQNAPGADVNVSGVQLAH